MPIYEYQCEACGHRLEALQKISEEPLSDCPACGQSRLQKLMSAAGFRLKGNGWYATDFKDGGKKKSGDDAKSGAEAAAKPAEKDKEKGGGGTDGAKAAAADS